MIKYADELLKNNPKEQLKNKEIENYLSVIEPLIYKENLIGNYSIVTYPPVVINNNLKYSTISLHKDDELEICRRIKRGLQSLGYCVEDIEDKWKISWYKQ